MSNSNEIGRAEKNRLLLWLFFSYVLLLIMSYGFPVTGDDWTFSLPYKTSFSFWNPFVQSYEVSLYHYQTTNGRLLGNFLITFICCSKVIRELFRCCIILLIQLYVYRLSGNRGLTSYLICLSLLIALPVSIVSQTYTWAAGFCNYVTPALLFLLYVEYAQKVYFREEQNRVWIRMLLLFFLGFCSEFFHENFSLGLCFLSLALFIASWIRLKHAQAALGAHFVGTILGCVTMFMSPGYQNVDVEAYRKVAHSLGELKEMILENYSFLSLTLTRNNLLVLIFLCLVGLHICLCSLKEDPSVKKWIVWPCICIYSAYPLICYCLQSIQRYKLVLDALANLSLFISILLTSAFCIRDHKVKFILFIASGSFVLYIAPLMFVHPVGARNAYFPVVILILIAMTLYRQAVCGRNEKKILSIALTAASCLLLAWNLWIHLENGCTEQLRIRIVEEAMERGEREIVLPDYPYPDYIHSASQVSAIERYYCYEYFGDIDFRFVPYEQWIEGDYN